MSSAVAVAGEIEQGDEPGDDADAAAAGLLGELEHRHILIKAVAQGAGGGRGRKGVYGRAPRGRSPHR